MTSKTRFNKSSAAGGTIVSGSKKANTGIGSGFAPAAKAPSNVQVIHNGKIVTPVSLLARPKVASGAAVASKGDPEVKDSTSGGDGGEEQANEEEKNKPITKKDSVANNRSR